MSEEDGERVAELESTVAELEATVRGLTEELVDATERIRQLEAATEVDPAGGHGRGTDGTEDVSPSSEDAGSGTDILVGGAADAATDADPDPDDAGGDGLIDGDATDGDESTADGAAEADTTKGPGAEGPPETEDGDEAADDDIIVA